MNFNYNKFCYRYAGQVGYVYCSMRSVKEAFIGGTLHNKGAKVKPLDGFVAAKPMVYAGVYPMDQSEHPTLRNALEKLLLNDASVECKLESRLNIAHNYMTVRISQF